MVYVIAFNGPPHSGKDTIAAALQFHLESLSVLPTRLAALSMPMRLAGFGMLGIPYSDEKYAEIKDQQIVGMNHKDAGGYTSPVTFRKWMIDFSEIFMKPTYGHNIWSRLLLAGVDTAAPGFMLVTDLGFIQEDLEFVDQVGYPNYLVVQLVRGGCDWSKDSRSYIDNPKRSRITLDNNGTVDEAVDHIMSQILRMGWVL